jgi:hypothetical protein
MVIPIPAQNDFTLSGVSFKDAEGWDIVVHNGFVMFVWRSNTNAVVQDYLEFIPNIRPFLDINSFSVFAAPWSFGRTGPWTDTLWAVDNCRGELIAPNRIKMYINVALQGNNSRFDRVGYSLTIKGHLGPQPD